MYYNTNIVQYIFINTVKLYLQRGITGHNKNRNLSSKFLYTQLVVQIEYIILISFHSSTSEEHTLYFIVGFECTR